jgi:acyl-coenzyme A thioesterase 13
LYPTYIVAGMKPTDKVHAAWDMFGKIMPFNSSGIKHLRALETDPFPEADSKGRKNLDGWKMSWEGTIPPGQSL